jgi:hypothetical protein
LPFRCDFHAYLRRCYVAPVLYRAAAGRCGTILGAFAAMLQRIEGGVSGVFSCDGCC